MMIRVYNENENIIFEGDAEDFLLFEVNDEYIDELEDNLNYLDTQKVGSMISFNYLTIEKIANIID